jgi:hypothetical protein
MHFSLFRSGCPFVCSPLFLPHLRDSPKFIIYMLFSGSTVREDPQ